MSTSTVESTMSNPTIPPRSGTRHYALGALAVAALVLPDSAYSVVADNSAEVLIVRLLLLVGLSLLAILPWVSLAGRDVQRRMRRWAIPGVSASAVYLVSAQALYLILGFCLLTGAALDVWATRAHVASETLRARLVRGDRDR